MWCTSGMGSVTMPAAARADVGTVIVELSWPGRRGRAGAAEVTVESSRQTPCNRAAPQDGSGLEAGGFLRSAGRVARPVGGRARATQLAALDDQVFLADRPVLEPAFKDLAGAPGVACLRVRGR